MKCGISGCEREADRLVTHAHPDLNLRWSVVMCPEHSKEVKQAGGELIFAALEPKAGTTNE